MDMESSRPPEYPERVKKTEVVRIPTELLERQGSGSKVSLVWALVIGVGAGLLFFFAMRPFFKREAKVPPTPRAAPVAAVAKPAAAAGTPSATPVATPAPLMVQTAAPVFSVESHPSAAQTDKSESDWLTECGRPADRSGRKACYEMALTARPAMLDVRFALFSILEEEADWKKAGFLCTESLAADTETGRNPLLLARCADADRHLLRCESGLYKSNKAIGIDPRLASAYLSRARLFAGCLDRCEAAVLDFRKYLELEPKGQESGEALEEMQRCLRAAGGGGPARP